MKNVKRTRVALAAVGIGLLLGATPDATAQERTPVETEEVKEEVPAPSALDEALLAEWELRDLEGRWVFWNRVLDEGGADGSVVDEWRHWLAARGEFELLERDALDALDWYGAASILFGMDAPQGMRVALWYLRSVDSHTMGGARTELSTRPARVLAYLEAHSQLLEDEKIKSLYDELSAQTTEREPVGHLLPPLEEDELYAPLLPTGERVEFGDRLVAVEGERYVHNTLHAIEVFAATKQRPEAWLKRFYDLAYAGNLRVRLAALQAATRMPAETIPWRRYLSLVDSRGEPAAVRVAALAAVSYGPRVIARTILMDRIQRPAGDPSWSLAITRTTELGGLLERVLLAHIADNSPDAEASAEAKRALTLLTVRIEEQVKALSADFLRQEIELTAWFESLDRNERQRRAARQARALLEGVLAENPKLGESLAGLATGYEAQPVDFGEGELADWTLRVRTLVSELSGS